ncbi:MAG: class I SAM-dependent methyltransferase [Bryobacterales bacterium]|nr:class I SAM-dependent methyltransferase [Bryobacterales bacterium]
MASEPREYTGASYYARKASEYPECLWDYIASKAALAEQRIAIDLGCGTGQLAIPLAAREMKVIAIDPSAEMLKEGINQASQDSSARNVRWLRGRGEDLLTLIHDPVDCVLFGRSFHLTDRPLMIRVCEQVTAGSGAVVVITGRWHDGRPAWHAALGQVISSFEQRPRFMDNQRPSPVSDEAILSQSEFCAVEKTSFRFTITRTLEDVLALSLSIPSCSPADLGDRCAAFQAALRRRLLDEFWDGPFLEHRILDVLWARKSDDPLLPDQAPLGGGR